MNKNTNYSSFDRLTKNLYPSCQIKKPDPTTAEKSYKTLQIFQEDDFEKAIQKMFKKKKFVLGNAYDYEGSEKFLKDKDECMANMYLSDEIEEKKPKSPRKKSKNKKNNRKETKSLDRIRESKIMARRKKRESFFSFGSSGCVDGVINLLD